MSFDIDNTVVQLFSSSAKVFAESIAVIHDDESITFKELDHRSQKLACILRSGGVKSETCVPIVLEPGIDMVIAILGVLKAGGAYVPVDAGYPEDRIAYLIQDINPVVIITTLAFSELLPKGFNRLHLNEVDYKKDYSCELYFPRREHLAYVIYTSGSTGHPKGVMVEHDQLIRYTMVVRKEFSLQQCESFGIWGTFSSDAGLTAVFNALCFGKRLSILSVKKAYGLKELKERFRKEPIDCYKITPSLVNVLLDNDTPQEILPKKKMIIGGEACSWSLASKIYNRLPAGCEFFNHYGPTETTVGVIGYRFPPKDKKFPDIIPLGKPFDNVELHILDDNLQPVSRGEIGELFIEGSLIARGYYNKDELTKQRFITISDRGQLKRVYRTGDRVKMLRDGNVEYLGRNDDQVKIAGNRVELKEIEQTLLSFNQIKECIVIVRSDQGSVDHLIAYIIPSGPFNPELLIRKLRRKLPGFMIPAKWIAMDKWPLTFNNKIDKKLLPDPFNVPSAIPECVQNADHMEGKLSQIWKKVFAEENIPHDKSFFDLGGDSLRLIQLSIEISDRIDIPLSAADIYKYDTIEKQADYARTYHIQTDLLADFNPEIPTIAQRNLFIQNKMNPGVAFPHASISFEIVGKIDLDKIQFAFNASVTNNEALRTFFVFKNGQVIAVNEDHVQFSLAIIQSDEEDIHQVINEITIPFKFGKAPLIRGYVISLANGRCFLHIDMPHISADGESLKVLMNELEFAYNSNERVDKSGLQFSDFKKISLKYRQSVQHQTDKNFWREELRPDFSPIVFKTNNNVSRFEGSSMVHLLNGKQLQYLEDFCISNNVTKFQLLTSLFCILIHRTYRTNDFALMVPVHNRNEKKLQQIIGLLANVVVLRVSLNAKEPFIDFLIRNTLKIRAMLTHQRFAFEEQLEIWRDQKQNIGNLYQFFFGYHDNRRSYRMGEALLKFIVPERNKENLPMSMAVFEEDAGLSIKISSSLYFSATSDLDCWMQSFLSFLDSVLTAPTVPIQDLITATSLMEK